MEHELVVRNTLLLRTYQEIDQRAWLLFMLVKVWAKQAGIADASHGTLSSYGWALLTIFYLQQCDPPVLPILQSEELAGEGSAWHRPACAATENWATSFCEDQAVAKATLAANPNTQTVTELLCGFFQFYGWSFRYKTMVISPRLGRAFEKQNYEPAQATKRSEWRFTIEDPFELNHDLGACNFLTDPSRGHQQYCIRVLTVEKLVLQESALALTWWILNPQGACCTLGRGSVIFFVSCNSALRKSVPSPNKLLLVQQVTLLVLKCSTICLHHCSQATAQ